MTNKYSALALVAFLGFLKLSHPFGGDQALFSVYANGIYDGGVLYKDFWDLKQPGIYFFYLLGGSLFGFNELGIHLFELVYFLLFSFFILNTFQNFFENRKLIFLLPVFTVGFYYIISEEWHLTQLEIIVSPLLYILFFCSLKLIEKSNTALFALIFGFTSGLILIFKFILLPIIASFWLYYNVSILVKSIRDVRILLKANLFAFLGFLLPMSVLFSYLYYSDSLNLFLWTTLQVPPRVINESFAAELGNQWGELKSSLKWFSINFSVYMSLTIVGLAALFRKNSYNFAFLLVLWILSTFLVILIQKTSWWEYHFILFVFPLGIASLIGLDFLLVRIKLVFPFNSLKNKIAYITAFLFLFNYHMIHVYNDMKVVKYRFAIDQTAAHSFKKDISPYYKYVSEDIDSLVKEFGNDLDSIYVLGDPRYLYLLRAKPRISLDGGSYTFWIDDIWKSFSSEMMVKKPKYLFVCNLGSLLIKNKTNHIQELIETEYKPYRTNREGVWYQRSNTVISDVKSRKYHIQ